MIRRPGNFAPRRYAPECKYISIGELELIWEREIYVFVLVV